MRKEFSQVAVAGVMALAFIFALMWMVSFFATAAPSNTRSDCMAEYQVNCRILWVPDTIGGSRG